MVQTNVEFYGKSAPVLYVSFLMYFIIQMGWLHQLVVSTQEMGHHNTENTMYINWSNNNFITRVYSVIVLMHYVSVYSEHPRGQRRRSV